VTISVLQEISYEEPGTSATTIVAPSITVTAGSSLHIAVTHGDSATVSMAATPLTVSGGSITFSAALDSINDAGNNQVLAHYKADGVAAGTYTITANFTAVCFYRGIKIKEIGGTSGYDATASAHAGQLQTAPTTGANATTSGNTPALTSQPALISGFCAATANSATTAVGTGFTSDQTSAWQFGTGINMSASESKRLTATSAVAATFTASTNDNRITVAAVFLESVVTAAADPVGIGFRSRTKPGRGPLQAGRYRIRESLAVSMAPPPPPPITSDYVVDRAGTNQARPGRGPMSLGRYFVRTGIDAYPAAASVYADSFAESGSSTDSVSGIASLIGALSESNAGADSIASALIAVSALSEAGSASDSDSSAQTAVGSVSESAAGSDTESAGLIAVAALTESASSADSLSSSTGNDSILSESGSSADSVSALSSGVAALSESGTATDSVSSVVTAVGMLSEAGSAADLVSSIAALIGQLSDALSGTDSLSSSLAGNTYSVSVAETSASSDSIATTLLAAAAIAESGSALDAHTTLMQAVSIIAEAGGATDTHPSQIIGLASLAEVAAAIDSLSAPRVPPRGKRIILVSGQNRTIRVKPN